MTDTLYKIRLLMVVRVVAVTALLVVAFLVELWFQPARSLRPLYILTAATYSLTIIYGLLYATLREQQVFIHLQLIGDILASSAFVYITGGTTSPFSFLYVPVILAAGMLLYQRGAYTFACLSSLAYGTLVVAILTGVLPVYPPGSMQISAAEFKRASFALMVHFLGFGLVAILASALSESLRRTGEELGTTRENLEDLQVFNALIIDSVNSGLITADPAGRITFLNRAAREITGLMESFARERSIQDLFDLPDDFIERLNRCLARARRFRFEVRYQVAAGVNRILGFTAGLLRDKERMPLGYIFTFQDLTEIKALEKEVLVRERMAAVGEMAAGMAHELRNPLASMSGSVQVLGTGIPTERRDQMELLEIIQRESLRLDQVLKDFLSFARPRPFNPELTDLVGLLTDLVRLLKNSPGLLPAHQVVTTFACQSLPCHVDVDRIKQVFWNLASNALRAMPAGGRLEISAGPARDGMVAFSFTDTGHGMTAEEMRNFFRPFRSRFDGGTGLGTAIVYRIVQEHNGRTTVDSEPGRGTKVVVSIPAQPVGTTDYREENRWEQLVEHVS
ncbi:MAG: nitrogen regulation protein NR(II) [Acidobacteriota bacterium]